MHFFLMIVVCILLSIILYSNIKIQLKYVYNEEEDLMTIRLKGLYGIFKYTIKISPTDLIQGNNKLSMKVTSQTKVKENASEIKPIINLNKIKESRNTHKNTYAQYKKIITSIKNKIVIEHVLWSTEFGTRDAAETAIIVGIIWTLKSSILSFLSNNCILLHMSVNTVPNYNIKIFRTSFDCIFRMKLGYIITTGIRILLLKIKDGGKNE